LRVIAPHDRYIQRFARKAMHKAHIRHVKADCPNHVQIARTDERRKDKSKNKDCRMFDSIDSTAFNFEQGQRARKLFAAVVLAALDDAIADDKKYGNGPDQIARWARSRDGREVLSCAGIDPNERVVKGLMDFVGKGVRTSVALSREESERRHLLEAEQAEAA
jgi:hypothetical protein